MFQTKLVEKVKTHILCSITFCLKSCCLWNNVQKYDSAREATGDNITWCTRFTCWITKATDTHSGYAILIAFPRQQWLRGGASILCLYVHYLPSLYLTMVLFLFSWQKVNGRISWTFGTDMSTQTARFIMSLWASLPLCWILGNVKTYHLNVTVNLLNEWRNGELFQDVWI
jgi:hypothetical protein